MTEIVSFTKLPKNLPLKKLGREYNKIAGYVKISDLARVNELIECNSANDIELLVHLEFQELEFNKVVLKADINQEVTIKCQRCAEDMIYKIETNTHVLLSHKLDKNKRFDNFEQVIINKDELLDLYQLIEDEIILSMPLVPKHQEDDLIYSECITKSNFVI